MEIERTQAASSTGFDRAENAIERLADDVEQILDRLVAGIESTITRIQTASGGGGAEEASDRLRNQASALEAIRAAVRGNDPVTLRTVATQLPAIQAAATAACSASLTDAAIASGHHTAEIHAEALRHMSMTDIAGRYDARSVAALSSDELALIEDRVGQHLDTSQQRERAAHGEIIAIADRNGADLSAYQAARARLQVDLARAEAGGSLTGRARATLLLSTNSAYGAEEAGADDRVRERLRQQMAEDERALRVAVRTEAAREAERRGMPRADRAAFIEDHETREMAAVEAEQAKLAEGRNVSESVGQAETAASRTAAENMLRESKLETRDDAGAGSAAQAEEEGRAADLSAFAALELESVDAIAPPAPTPASPPAPTARTR